MIRIAGKFRCALPCLGCTLAVLLLAGVARAQQTPPATGSRYTLWPSVSPTLTSNARQRDQQPKLGQAVPLGGREEFETPAPYTIQLEPPSIYRVAISVESDAQLHERIRQENRERKMPGGKMPERLVFPNDPIISTDTYQGRKWYPMRLEVAPYYLCHGRLAFQQINFERYGWDLGPFSPLASAGMFLFDFVAWPYKAAKEPCRRIEYNTGWCLPGDPVPFLLYPIQLSPTGFVAEVGTILTLVAVFP
ncbi:MAG TPA: hypothetical protein VE999_08760 [Gemmataceae bacterium]|nr:hypothetical protein [Gemmataceae bacterium]